MSNLSIFCWNISNPSLERAKKQAKWLIKRPENILVLTEAKKSNGCLFLEDFFISHDYNIVFPKPANKDYAVMIVSKLPINPTIFSTKMKFLNSRIVSVETSILDKKIEIIGVYVPSRDTSKEKILRKKLFLKKLLYIFRNNYYKGERIFCGDLNLLEPSHIPHYSFFKKWEYDFYSTLKNDNLTDAFRHLNSLKKDYSWIGRTGDGYRYDHCFISDGLLKSLSKSYYFHNPRKIKLSDHAAIITELQINP